MVGVFWCLEEVDTKEEVKSFLKELKMGAERWGCERKLLFVYALGSDEMRAAGSSWC